ncbi:MAG: hypothetical protein HYT39_01630 [Candidatus Sungbacteria bacterium]|nr:hypothetical protein [Candidatus Sungbacteria bacterium]
MSRYAKHHELLVKLSQVGAIKKDGTRLKIHDAHPDLEPAPVYFNLRTPRNPKPGPLTENLLAEIGILLRKEVLKANVPYAWCAGIPNAGTDIAKWFSRIHLQIPMLKLRKDMVAEKVCSISLDALLEGTDPFLARAIRRGMPGLLLDNVIGAATSKFPWLDCFKMHRINISALVVVFDREEGGVEEIKRRYKIPVVRLYQYLPALRALLNSGELPPDTYEAALRFRRKVIALTVPSEARV